MALSVLNDLPAFDGLSNAFIKEPLSQNGQTECVIIVPFVNPCVGNFVKGFGVDLYSVKCRASGFFAGTLFPDTTLRRKSILPPNFDSIETEDTNMYLDLR